MNSSESPGSVTGSLAVSLTAALVFVSAFLSGIRGPALTPDRAVATVPVTERSGAMEALEFWSEARAYPGGNLPPDAYYRAFEKKMRMTPKQDPLPFATSAWNYIGPANLSGRTIALAVNPQNRNTLYAGSASGGLWRSWTGGMDGDWERVSTGFPVLGVGAIAIDPADSNIMYVGTGEVYRYGGTAGGLVIRTTRGSYGMGILKTSDAGFTWTKTLDWSYNQERGVQAIRFNPLNPSTVWAATTEGLYRTTDDGQSWTNMLPITMGQDIVIHQTDTTRMLASLGNLGISPYILKSTDGGSNWFQVTPVDFTGKTLLAPFAGNPEVVYASIADSTTGVASLWRTDDFGDSWSKLSDQSNHNIFGVQGWYSHFVAVHPVDSTQLLHAAVSAARSSDGGYTFGGVGGLYSDNHAYAVDPVDPDVLYAANDGGVYRSTDFGSTFTGVSVGLGTGQFYNGFSVSATDSQLALGQVQDHIPGYLYAGSDTWPRSAADEVGWTAIDQTNDNIMYAGTRGGQSMRKSVDRGASFGGAGSSFGGLACWNAPFVLSTSHPSVLYFGRSRIYISTNGAGSWSVTADGAEPDGNPAISMAMSSLGPDTVYVGTAPRVTRTHVFVTTNGGGSWIDVTGPLPDRHPLDIAVDPADAAVAYVGYGGYGTGHVFKTTDVGASWTDITGTLPDIPATALLVDPLDPAVVYLGTDLGVYVSPDGGASWIRFDEGLPDAVLVSDLTMTPSNRTLRASTHGNGVFERKIPITIPAVTVVSPNGGEMWETGTVETISWSATLLDTVDIAYSTDDGATWTDIGISIPAWPDSLDWTIPPTLTGAGRIRVRSSADSAVFHLSASPFTIYFEGVILEAEGSWNLVSLPFGVADASRNALFPGAVGSMYTYGAGYVPRDTLAIGEGYWLNYAVPALIPLGGDSIRADTVALSKGWNLVGSVSVAVPAGALYTVPPSLITTPFYGYDGGYSEADTILPGRGYWMKSSAAGSLVIDADAPPLAPPRAAGGRIDVAGPRNALITVTDAAGRSATLFLGDRESGAPSIDLPPAPPAGGFDVRFDVGARQVILDDRQHPVRLLGVEWPLTVDWEVPEGSSYILVTREGTVRVEGTGGVRLAAGTAISFRRGRAGPAHQPGSFALSRNYPNPFNPSTRIAFSVPGGGSDGAGTNPLVTLRVYDVAGRLVATLAEKEMPAGDHEITWDAGDLPGGVYFAELLSGGSSLSIKMLLLK